MSRRRELYGFQQYGVVRLVTNNSVLLADDMGLGKTVQVISAMRALFASGAVCRAIIICPATLIANWIREVKSWAPNLVAVPYRGVDRYGLLESGVPVLVTSFETIAEDWRGPSNDGKDYFDSGFDLIVVDEAQRLKNPASLRSRVCSRALVGRRWALSGTPMENRPEELASVLRFLTPNDFQDTGDFSDYEKILRLRDRLMLRRAKDEVLPDIPEKIVGEVFLPLAPAQRAEYEYERDRVGAALSEAPDRKSRSQIILTGIQRLRRLAVMGEPSKESSKLDYLVDEVERIIEAGEKVVVFTTFANIVLPVAAARLERFRPVVIRGEMSLDERDAASTSFLNDPSCQVMLASTMAGGVGLTWTVARFVIHLDLWWNPQVMSQADDRVHRIGQTRSVLVRRLVSAETIEENLVLLLNRKRAVFRRVIEESEVRALDLRASDDDLLALLGVKAQVGP